MDVNGTRHLAILGADWRNFVSDELAWNERVGSLTLAPRVFVFSAPRATDLVQPEDRRGAARDRFGNWFAIGADGTEIRARFASGDAWFTWWDAAAPGVGCGGRRGGFAAASPPPATPAERLAGLCVTSEHYLVVGSVVPAGLLVFDLHAGDTPFRVTWPDAAFVPHDLSAAPDGGVWILELGSRRKAWRLDRTLRPPTAAAVVETASQFQPGHRQWVDGVPEPVSSVTGDGGAVAVSLPEDPTREPVAIEALPDGRALVVTTDPLGIAPSIVLLIDRSGVVDAIELAPFGAMLDGVESLLTLHVHDATFVPAAPPARTDSIDGVLYAVGGDGNQAFAWPLSVSASGFGAPVSQAPESSYLPMRRFGGRALVRAGAPSLTGVYYDSGADFVPLTEQPRPKFVATGTFYSDVLDSRTPGCVWHRILIDGCVPSGAELEIASVADDERTALEPAADHLDALPWYVEPTPYLRANGSEIPWREELTGHHTGTWETLFQRATGRYARLRVTLRGDRRSSPLLRAMRIYHPRFSYLRYLPALYSADPTSASFLDRFLANVEGQMTDLEGRVAEVERLFDPRTVPEETLAWLASWIGLTFEDGLDTARRRLLLRHAPQFFRERGTLRGVLRAVRLADDKCVDDSLFEMEPDDHPSSSFGVRIVEQFVLRPRPAPTDADIRFCGGRRLDRSTDGGRWRPESGPESLDARLRPWLEDHYAIDDVNARWGTSFGAWSDVRFPAVPPATDDGRSDWRTFVAEVVGVPYLEASDSDLTRYRRFLAERYADIGRLREAHAIDVTSFAAVTYPAFLPARATAYADWIEFTTCVLPMHRHAHRFVVLIPTRPGEDDTVRRARMDLIELIVNIQKPAHTQPELREYWAMFRVGEARLGYETKLDFGSRFAAIELGTHYLDGSGVLDSPHPWNVTGRRVVGRDAAERAQPTCTGPAEKEP